MVVDNASCQAQSDDDLPSSPPIPPRSVDRQPNTRPQLFPSLEEAHSHIHRSHRNASIGPHQAHDRDGGQTDATAQATSTPMLRVPHNTPNDGPSGDFAICEDVPQPLNTSRFVPGSTKAQSQVSGSSVDQIVDHYAQKLSSEAQSHATACDSDSEYDYFVGQTPPAVRATASAPATSQAERPRGTARRAVTPFARSDAAHASTETDLPDMQEGTSEIPIQSPNPFSAAPISPVSEADSWTSRPILDVSDSSESDCDRAKVGSDLGAGSRGGSEEAPSVAESKVGQLIPPPARMNSARGHLQQRGRNSMASYKTNSIGGAMTDESDEDPFSYDHLSIFHQPTKEREVSARLRKVSGVGRESTATVYSQDGTPSKSYYEDQYFADDQPASPNSARLRKDLADLPPQTHNPMGEPSKEKNRAGKFYDPTAIKSEWALGSPDVVKVPVKQAKDKENRFARDVQDPAEVGEGQSKEMNRAARQHREETQTQANRMTGNTED